MNGRRAPIDEGQELWVGGGVMWPGFKKTGGNRSGLTGYRSNRSGPVPVPAGTQPAKIQNSKLNSKKMKIF